MPIRMPRITAMLLSGVFALSGSVIAQTPAGSPPPAASSTAQSKELTQAQLEQLLAPVALYPDALLAQILMASTYPLEVVEAARWRKANPSLKEKALDDALMTQPWDESVKSLTTFPPVLEMMNEKLSWTQQLGDAFLADQQRVMSAVQKLRKAANDTGNLKSTKEQVVVVEQAASETIIKIEPANPQVVYVPSYNPTVVYGAWPYPAYPPYPYYPPGYAPGAAFWTFTAGVVVGAALWGNCNWGSGNVEINNNVNRNTNVTGGNRTNVAGGGQGGQGGQKWNHNPDHRRGVSYKDQGVAQKYDRGGASARDAKSREQFRGHAEAGRNDMGQRSGGGNRAGTSDRMASGGRDSGGRGGASAGTRDASYGGGRQASGFGGADQGRQASDFGSRGQSSRQGASGGSRGGSSASAGSRGGGGGGGRSGGGGGGRGGGRR